MSVEKMEMMNVIGYIDDLDKVSMEIIRQGSVHIVNALNEINENDFTVLTPEQNTNALVDLCFIKPYNKQVDLTKLSDRISELMDIFKVYKGVRKKHLEENFEFNELSKKIEYVYEETKGYKQILEKEMDEFSRMQEFRGYIESISECNIDFSVLKNLKYFDFKIGRITKDNYEKLKDNIENISSIIYNICSIPGSQIVVSLTPKVLLVEVNRILSSLNFEEIDIPYNLIGTPKQIMTDIDEKVNKLDGEIKKLNNSIYELSNKYSNFIGESYSKIELFEKAQLINSEVACTKEFFYMAGWVPVSEKEGLKKILSGFGNRLILVFKPKSEVNKQIIPPTRLKNNWLVRPFESLVRMYGIPSFDELDPTTFVAISYMIMFGCMFGDLGQGFIFLIAGIYLATKGHRPNFGGILSRLGVSSMVFGVLFGSVFGNEEIIKPVIFHPMDNINMVLLGGVVLGIILTSIGFIFSLINAFKRRDIEGGVFGKDGVVGITFYWIILLTALSVYKQSQTLIPLPIIIAILIILLAFMILKQPIASLISGKRPLYRESIQDYYIESGFGILETLLSMLSNTISFIRVGAFALNHVGLFVAFATISHMMKTNAGSIAMLVLGNIIIISLEGLIVFIQGLRLEYYELFSKYYDGSGIEYEPMDLKYTRRPINNNAISDVNINISDIASETH